jgi:hypothetical protein
MMLGIAIALLVLWLLLRLFFKVAKWSIHIILVVAVIAIALHFLRAA